MGNKPLYAISIVAEMLQLHPQTLRQYEKLGLVTPSRTLGNTRVYSDEDIDRLRFINTLSKEMGVNTAGIEIILNMRDQIDGLQEQVDALKKYIKTRMNEHHKTTDTEKAVVPSPPRNIIKVKIEKE
ncbi:heat shock protein transcriptional repressor HspR [Limisalsivibrio acetivorans]|uniref:heat shock protein transcriptional repressor HspR n=1 Tax=Limisalsivibrio acetivorans TaxID=1304888 RepID=UPI0003B4BD2C|nr:helix-turn-helix transcriptional regulator [Limisalsivibrio acetivorans]